MKFKKPQLQIFILQGDHLFENLFIFVEENYSLLLSKSKIHDYRNFICEISKSDQGIFTLRIPTYMVVIVISIMQQLILQKFLLKIRLHKYGMMIVTIVKTIAMFGCVFDCVCSFFVFSTFQPQNMYCSPKLLCQPYSCLCMLTKQVSIALGRKLKAIISF